ncbi:MAG TPA: lantibiotic dehydratase C-terminal domain-containing protein, partial [Bryobacteraceae bacterium]
ELNEAERLRWYRSQTNARAVEIGADYRQRKNLLRFVVGQPGHFLAGLDSGKEIAAILAERSAASAGVAERLRGLAREQSLTQPIETLCGSFVHLHLNRMSIPESPSERHLLSLLLRTRESLEKAPVALTSSSSV